MVAVLDYSAGLLHDHFGHLDVPCGLLVERAGDDFDRIGSVAAEIGHFFGPLIDQQHDDVHVRVVFRDRIGDLLEDDGLAGSWWGNDERPLAEPERCDQVDDARLDDVRLGFEDESFVRM